MPSDLNTLAVKALAMGWDIHILLAADGDIVVGLEKDNMQVEAYCPDSIAPALAGAIAQVEFKEAEAED